MCLSRTIASQCNPTTPSKFSNFSPEISGTGPPSVMNCRPIGVGGARVNLAWDRWLAVSTSVGPMLNRSNSERRQVTGRRQESKPLRRRRTRIRQHLYFEHRGKSPRSFSHLRNFLSSLSGNQR